MPLLTLLGVLLAMVGYAISVSPSLLPRRWWWHGFVSGIVMGLGYVLGWVLTEGVRWLGFALDISVTAPQNVSHTLRVATVAAVALWMVRACWQSYWAGRQAAEMQEMKPVGPWEYLAGFAASFLMFGFVIEVAYLIVNIFDLSVKLLAPRMYVPLAIIISAVAVMALVLFVSNKVVFKFIMAVFERKAVSLNTTSGDGYEQPRVPQRSGSPESLSPWPTIGGQGRKFLTKGPSAEMIWEVRGEPALEPIRIYVGMPKQNANLEAIADLALADLERSGAFERAVILVNTATGSGWVDEWLVQPMEYLTGGDCAVVTMQYSYLFSAAMMVSDLEPCAQAGRYLFEKVERRIAQMPREDRPLLIVGGESLGAYGSQFAFADLADLKGRVDGAIWTGSPQTSPLHKEGTSGRHRGSPQVAPVFENGRNVRFVNNPSQLDHDIYGRELPPWEFPRIVFAQHASDPVVFFTFDMAYREPDWIRERSGVDVSDQIRFTPLTTFVQGIADLPVAGTAPSGHGHSYHRELVDVWAKILGFDGEEARGRLGATSWFTPEMKVAIGDAIEKDDQRDP